MFCKNCGKELKDDALFCPKCGQKIKYVEQIKKDAAESKNAVVAATPFEAKTNIPNDLKTANIQSQPTKTGKGAKWGIIGGVAAGVIAIAALVIVLVVNKGLPAGSLSANSTSENGMGLSENAIGNENGNPDAVDADGENADNTEPTIAIVCREVIYNENVSNVRLVLKSGHDNSEGDVVYETTTQEDGIAEMTVAKGEYTLCWEIDGYYSGYENLNVDDGGIYLVKHLVPYQTEQKAYILVEWNSDKDLDLCVYNAQTKQYINIFYPTDDAGDFLYGDNTGAQGYELIYLKDYTDGIYTIYVRDNASLIAGTTSNMAADDLKVSIYTADGLIYQEKAAENQTAALWSPVYLYQGQTYELANYIYDLNEYEWATWDKSDAEFVESLQNQAQNQTQTTAQPQTQMAAQPQSGTTDTSSSNTGNQSQPAQQTQSQLTQQSSNEESEIPTLTQCNDRSNARGCGYYYDNFSHLYFDINSACFASVCYYDGIADNVVIPEKVRIEGEVYSVNRIEQYAFSGCSSLESIEMPDSLMTLGVYAFNGCSLTSIEIPDSVIYIESHTFEGCSCLTNIELPNGMLQIKDYAFSGCSSLTSIEIPDSVTDIGTHAFSGCSNLTSIEIPDSVTNIGTHAFECCCSLTNIKLSNGILIIEDYAFGCCESLTSIEIPDSVRSLGSHAFSCCEGLTSIEIPESVTYIGNYAFESCRSLESIEIPESVTHIGAHAFTHCDSLTNIEIPESVYIDPNVFDKM